MLRHRVLKVLLVLKVQLGVLDLQVLKVLLVTQQQVLKVLQVLKVQREQLVLRV